MHPILFKLGDFPVYTYGFLTATAILSAYFLCSARADQFGYSKAFISDFLTLCCLSGIIGARLFYVFQHPHEYRTNPFSALALWEGGLVWYGGFFGAVGASLIWARLTKTDIWKLADFISPALAFSHAVGRIGCFLNGCCSGKTLGDFTHPVQLYESTGLLILSALLFWRPYFWLYLLGYGLLRFGLEFLRAGQEPFGFFSLPQWTSLMLMAASLILWNHLKSKSPKS